MICAYPICDNDGVTLITKNDGTKGVWLCEEHYAQLELERLKSIIRWTTKEEKKILNGYKYTKDELENNLDYCKTFLNWYYGDMPNETEMIQDIEKMHRILEKQIHSFR